MKRFSLLFGFLLVVGSVLAEETYKPPQGYVPDEKTAISIAVAVWEPIYGVDNIARQKPYRATLRDGIWIVEGTLPKGFLGGTAIAHIAKDDGRILRIIHYK